MGCSNGANILAAVLFETPGLFVCVVPIPWTPAPQPGPAGREVLPAAGRRDPICPLPQTRALANGLKAQGTRLGVALHGGGHEITQPEPEAVADFLRRP